MKKRILWLDSLKGFAILCVVIGHAADGYLGSKMFPDSDAVLYGFLNAVYIFHMPLFFIISGYTFRLSYFSDPSAGEVRLEKRERYQTQILNLVFLYLFFSAFMIVFKMLVSGHVNGQVSFADLFMIWARPVSPYWYLYVLVIYYICFMPLAVRLSGYREITAAVLLGLSLASGFVDPNMLFSVNNLLYNALFFWIGICLYENNRYINKGSIAIAAVISLICIAVNWNDRQMIRYIPIVSTIAALGISAGFYQTFKEAAVLDRRNPLSITGQHSLEIYLLHIFFTAGNRLLLPLFGIRSFGLSFVLNILISVIMPILIAEVCRRIHVYSLFFRPWTALKDMTAAVREKQGS